MRRKSEEVFEAPAGGFRFGSHHPARTLAAELEARGLSARAFALKLRILANRISKIISGRRGPALKRRFG